MVRSSPARILILAALSTSSGLSAQGIEVTARDGQVSIVAENAPIREVAARLAEATGIAVSVTGDADTRVTLQVNDESLETAVSRLSPNYLLVHVDDSGASPVTEVVLMLDDARAGGTGGAEQFLPSGEPAEPAGADAAQTSDDPALANDSAPPELDDDFNPDATLEGEGLEAGPQ